MRPATFPPAVPSLKLLKPEHLCSWHPMCKTMLDGGRSGGAWQMKERFVDGHSPLENQRDQLTAIEQNEQAELVEYAKEEDSGERKLNRARFNTSTERDESGLHLVVVPQGQSPEAVVRAQQSQGKRPVFDSPSTVYVDGQETQILGFKNEDK
jgi:hypothetical protein